MSLKMYNTWLLGGPSQGSGVMRMKDSLSNNNVKTKIRM